MTWWRWVILLVLIASGLYGVYRAGTDRPHAPRHPVPSSTRSA